MRSRKPIAKAGSLFMTSPVGFHEFIFSKCTNAVVNVQQRSMHPGEHVSASGVFAVMRVRYLH